MTDFSDRSKSIEDSYFIKKEKELIESLRRQAGRKERRDGLADAVGLDNEEILDVLQHMGFDSETVMLLFAVPLIEVAWSDGSVSEAERNHILEAARAYGIIEGHPSHARLLTWLSKQPEPIFFERALVVIRDIVRFRSDASWQEKSRKLVDACQAVAGASGGLLGLGSKVSAKEKAVLDRVAAELEKAHAEAATRLKDKLQS